MMAFRLARDVRVEVERLARRDKRDPNDILRELLGLPRKGAKKFGFGSMEKAATIFPQRFYDAPKADRLPWGRTTMRSKKNFGAKPSV